MTKNDSIARINDIEYFYNILLSNADNKSVQLTQEAVKMLVIEDNIDEPFVSGYVIIDNSDNVLQRVYKNQDEEEVEERFDFNLKERDYLYVDIVPKFREDQTKDDINQEVWALNYIFTIYDIEDYEDERVRGNLKKLYFMDFEKFEFMDKTSTFSTANIQKGSDVSEYLRDDSDRSEYTGNILKEIIKEANPKAKFDDNWDIGSNKIFYTSPINNDYLMDIQYIYSIHQSNVESDFCILSKQRYTDKWYLDSFESIVESALNQSDKTKAGIELMEAFIISDTADMPKIPKKSRIPTDFNVNYNTTFGDLSKIDRFKLIEMSKLDSSDYLQTKVAHTYNFDEGKFEIYHHDISQTEKFFNEKYVGKLNTDKSVFKAGVNQLANKKLQHNYACKYEQGNTYEFLARNSVLKSQYVFGLGMEFSITGFTNRQSGKFFSVKKDHNYYDNYYESKLQGIWLCTNVTHVFTETSYNNNISGIKLNLS